MDKELKENESEEEITEGNPVFRVQIFCFPLSFF